MNGCGFVKFFANESGRGREEGDKYSGRGESNKQSKLTRSFANETLPLHFLTVGTRERKRNGVEGEA